MKFYSEEITFKTKGNCDIVNITDKIETVRINSGFSNGLCSIFAVGSTTGITTLEYESGLLKDLPELLNKLIPKNQRYNHDDTWGDGNGFSHLRSALFKTNFSIPLINSQLVLGTWQQVVFIDFDNRPRNRRIIVQLIGE